MKKSSKTATKKKAKHLPPHGGIDVATDLLHDPDFADLFGEAGTADERVRKPNPYSFGELDAALKEARRRRLEWFRICAKCAHRDDDGSWHFLDVKDSAGIGDLSGRLADIEPMAARLSAEQVQRALWAASDSGGATEWARALAAHLAAQCEAFGYTDYTTARYGFEESDSNLLSAQVERLARDIVSKKQRCWDDDLGGGREFLESRGHLRPAELSSELVDQAREIAVLIDGALLTENRALLAGMLAAVVPRQEEALARALEHVETALTWWDNGAHKSAAALLLNFLPLTSPAFSKLAERDIETVLAKRGRKKAPSVTVQLSNQCRAFGHQGRSTERDFTKARQKVRSKPDL